MKIQVLEDLYNEINRLFIAGAKFSQNDPRITKLIPVLQKLGEKSPPIKRLAEYTENLAANGGENAAQALLETGTFLYALLNTQTSPEPDEDYISAGRPSCAAEFPVTKNSYLNVKPVIDALSESGSGRIQVLTDAYNNGLFNDSRLYSLYSKAMGDKYSEVVDLVFEKIIPSIGRPMTAFLLEDYDYKGGKADARRLSLLYRLGYEKSGELALQAVNESSLDIQVAAIEILKEESANEELLLSLAGSKKGDIRREALAALAQMNSEKGKKRLLEVLQSAQYESALKAAAACRDEETAREIFECVQKAYEAAREETDEKKKAAAVERYSEFAELLEDRTEDYVFDFCAKVCADTKDKALSRTRDKILRLYFAATAKVYSPEKHYDTFIGMYKKEAAYSLGISGVYFNSDKPITFDRRWLSAFIEEEDVNYVGKAMLALKTEPSAERARASVASEMRGSPPDDEKAVNCLANHLKKGMVKKEMQDHSRMCIERLIDVGYKGLDKIVFTILENHYDNVRNRYWYIWYEQIYRTVTENPERIFSKDYIEKFDALHEKAKTSAAANAVNFSDIANTLRKHYGEDNYGT